MRTPLVVGNWKMHKTVREARDLADRLRRHLAGTSGVDIVVCPPFTALADVGRVLAGSPIELGAQDVHWEPQGAFTGEISAPMLWDLGCTYVIVGHSERRRLLDEDDETVGRKVAAALAAELIPILCVGESLDEREAGRTERIVQTQARVGTLGVTPEQASHLVVAYEPVWAIGTGQPATGEEANRIAGLLRGWLRQWYGEAADHVRILYGGSVTPQTIAEFAGQPEIDGALVGGASLDAEAFAAIVAAVSAQAR
ncbi:MAG: triose-phosphate isomerase [Armatimonadota bacterium]|nr:triose-phosphate isomerase [Armatimonadota bacterium]MDR7520341.1 triose-phosphate isomerase [Armatimonadota bacterium]MDR7550910.1 triose-phosphate isomerase [Armatimonadota bacterium]